LFLSDRARWHGSLRIKFRTQIQHVALAALSECYTGYWCERKGPREVVYGTKQEDIAMQQLVGF
jgi:hypothetical protein